MIVVENLTRKYGTYTAVNDVGFRIEEGEIVGLLGHNGAGKTTIMKMMTGFLEPTAGSITIDGHNIESRRTDAQSLIGYLPENCPLYPEMSIADHLEYAAELRRIPRAEQPAAMRNAMAATELLDRASEPVANLSRGYRQRVGVAQALLHTPKILILDEPTNGLDPSQIRHMRDLIQERAKAATIILSTHILQEVQAVCDRVIIIKHGKVALDSRLDALQSGGHLRLVTNGAPDVVTKLAKKTGLIEAVEPLPSSGAAHTYDLRFNGHAVETVAPKVARAVHDAGLDLLALHPGQRDLETVFAEITAS